MQALHSYSVRGAAPEPLPSVTRRALAEWGGAGRAGRARHHAPQHGWSGITGC